MFKRSKPEDGAAATPETAPLFQPRPLAADTSALGVPPFRPAEPAAAPTLQAKPAHQKDAVMPPFPAASPPMPQAGAPRPPALPATPRPSFAGRETERRTLVVGRGISVQGMVQDAERFVVEGTVEANMIHATELSVSQGGVFRGEVEVEDAEVAGTLDGTVTARGSLVVRATGVVLGVARCRRLVVEEGGQITGRIEMLTEGRAAEAPSPASASAASPATTPPPPMVPPAQA